MNTKIMQEMENAKDELWEAQRKLNEEMHRHNETLKPIQQELNMAITKFSAALSIHKSMEKKDK